MLKTIISGGQTGVDRGALDAALAAGLACGGWCPRGRRAEDGPIPGRYPLEETRSAGYGNRTRRNVESADGTLILARAPLSGGTAATEKYAGRVGKPCLVLRLDRADVADLVDAASVWIGETPVRVLNVAGPRESGAPGIQAEAERFVAALIGQTRRS